MLSLKEEKQQNERAAELRAALGSQARPLRDQAGRARREQVLAACRHLPPPGLSCCSPRRPSSPLSTLAGTAMPVCLGPPFPPGGWPRLSLAPRGLPATLPSTPCLGCVLLAVVPSDGLKIKL